ncbi:DUF6252 family protein [Hymenobacter properus]|uniref:Carboxypeptidase regulatory-like domain-containing protein n=1 Tax=Hymenobacter properus TaxID=2791026 RepID=A0A931BFG4_9BACT|nr:DUF6252 family protein [Hymenobacter properus]MBF9140332.1 carboxypeptidase regulatory-like domain-containing protein [Hymenobacter properus]MBR7719139.1 carboxypeptidase regulatory-like domain-containing protein [Microvirga sp. SRT04]
MSFATIFRPIIASLTVLGVLAAGACSKKEAATPNTGNVTGVITPIDAAATVMLNDQSNKTISTTTSDATTGAFTFNGVQVGAYTVTVQPTRGYVAPAPKPVTVAGGQTTDMGQVKVAGDGTPHGVVTWRVNGVNYRATNLTGSMLSNPISITATVTNGTVIDYVYFTIKNNNYQTGTYNVTRNAADPYAFYATYARFDGYTRLVEYTTNYVPSSATINGALTITASDPTAKTLRGTFDFLGYSTTSLPASTVTDGTFDIHY